MKKIFFVFLINMVLLLEACSDFLIKDPLDKVTDVSLTYTADQCKIYVNKYYTVWGSPNSVLLADLGSDNLLSYSYSNNPDLIDNRVVPESGGGWGVSEWGNIRSINFLLDNMFGQSKLWNAINQYTACKMESLKYGDLVAFSGKNSCTGKSGRTGPDDSYLMTI